MALVPVAIDLRDPNRSGIARVATSIARHLVRNHSDEFAFFLAGPADEIAKLQPHHWGAPTQIVDWSERRYSVMGLGWLRARQTIGNSLWYFPHWDVPALAMSSDFVATIHDLAHLQLGEFSGLKGLVARGWMTQTIRNAAAIATVSEYSAVHLRNIFPASAAKLSVVPNGVDEDFSRPAPALNNDVAARLSGAGYMLSVGIKKERKNLQMGVEILKAIPQLKWIVAGEWFPEWQRVEAIAREAGVLERMIVLERQDEASLRSLYASAEFLLFPSRYEGFGLPIVEALASGTPVIASRATSIPEVLGDAGWLCNPDDPAAFVAAAKEVLALGPKRAAAVDRGRERARAFTWERSADALARLLRASATRSGQLKSS